MQGVVPDYVFATGLPNHFEPASSRRSATRLSSSAFSEAVIHNEDSMGQLLHDIEQSQTREPLCFFAAPPPQRARSAPPPGGASARYPTTTGSAPISRWPLALVRAEFWPSSGSSPNWMVIPVPRDDPRLPCASPHELQPRRRQPLVTSGLLWLSRPGCLRSR